MTPDKVTYMPGEEIHLPIVGDAEGAAALAVSGELTFDPLLGVTYVTSSQQPLESFGGAVSWTLDNVVVPSGGVVAVALDPLQFINSAGLTVGNLLQATVMPRSRASSSPAGPRAAAGA